MKKYVRCLLIAVLALPVAAVLSVATTLLLLPLWSWLESFSGIESVGHSGPAGWCYCFVFALILAVLAAAVFLRGRIRRSR